MTIESTVQAWGRGFDPDRRRNGSHEDMSPALFSRMLRGEITPHQAQQEHEAAREQGQQFNDQLRAAAGLAVDRTQPRDPAGRYAAGDEPPAPTGMNLLLREAFIRGPRRAPRGAFDVEAITSELESEAGELPDAA